MRAVVRLAHITVITSAPCTSVRHRAWSVGGRSGSAREGGAEVDFDPRANPSPTSRSQFHPSDRERAERILVIYLLVNLVLCVG